jgi:hypothetical protein
MFEVAKRSAQTFHAVSKHPETVVAPTAKQSTDFSSRVVMIKMYGANKAEGSSTNPAAAVLEHE